MATERFRIKGVNTNVSVQNGKLMVTTENTGTMYPFKILGTNTNLKVKNGRLVIRNSDT